MKKTFLASLLLLATIVLFAVFVCSCSGEEEYIPNVSYYTGRYALENVKIYMEGEPITTVSSFVMESDMVDGYKNEDGAIVNNYYSKAVIKGFPTEKETSTISFIHQGGEFKGHFTHDVTEGKNHTPEYYEFTGKLEGFVMLLPKDQYITIHFTKEQN